MSPVPSGRVHNLINIAAYSVLAAGALTSAFGGDYAKAGAIMGTIYALGMVVIWFAPDTTGKKLED